MREPKSDSLPQNYTNTSLDEGQKDQTNTWELNSSSSAMEGSDDGDDSGDTCQEIGLVTFMFFFELLFSYVSLQFSSMFPLLTYFQSFISLSADHPRHSRRRRSQI